MQGAAVAAARQPNPSASTKSSGLFAKLNFMSGRRRMDDHDPDHGHEPDHEDDHDHDHDDAPPSTAGSRALATAIHQQHRTRRRRGSLRKVALLSRGAQRDKRDSSPLISDTADAPNPSGEWSVDTTPKPHSYNQGQSQHGHYDALGLKNVGLPTENQGHRRSDAAFSSSVAPAGLAEAPGTEHDTPILYHSTTDEEEGLQLPPRTGILPLSSGSESYFPSIPSAQRRTSAQQTKSPPSYSGLTTTPLQSSDAQVDYAETEWWGWIILIVTWLVFVVGMGSCLGVWSWAWDVGKTPYAPPELEDDPTLPIVGYYPALIILTGVMAWVWVVVAWVGMKYFRHAKISGD